MTALAIGGTAALVVASLAHDLAPRVATGRPGHPGWLARGAGRVGGVAAVGAIVLWAPPLLPLGAVGWWARRTGLARRDHRAREEAVRRALPDLVDLLRLATSAGLSLSLAHEAVAPLAPAPLDQALEGAAAAVRRGAGRADALHHALVPFGEASAALAHVLGDHLRYGVPLLPGLERLGLELRLDRRRAAERAARRVPVRLLGPLVTCVLPAFALLTVVPLLVASLAALPL